MQNKTLKKKRSRYNTAFRGDAKAIGIVYHTPCVCSCHMCGNQRKHHGPNMQEKRQISKSLVDLKSELL